MNASLPPGPSLSPLRQTLWFLRDPVGFAEDCRARYGDVYTTKMLGMSRSVNVTRTDAVREIFANAGDTMHAGEVAEPIEFLLGRHSLVRLDGPQHKRHRKLMMPAVHGDRMAAYGAQIRAITAEVTGRLRPGDVFDLQPTMQEITLRVILETVFGLAPGERQDELRRLLVAFLRDALGPVPTFIGFLAQGDRTRRWLSDRVAPAIESSGPLAPLLHRIPGAGVARRARALDTVLRREIATRRAAAEEGSDVMSMLIRAVDEDGQRLTDDELRDEMITLLVGGHETTATTLTWALALCLEHPEVADEARREVERVFAGEWNPARVSELKYVDAIARETLRLYPVALAVGRRLKQRATVAGFDLPEGTVVTPNIYLIQRDPGVWPHPLRFDPARFLDKKPKPTEWLPFGGGVRTCLGMSFSLYEMKIVLPMVLQRLRLTRLDPLPHLAQRGILLGPAHPIRVRVEAVAGSG